MINPRKKLREVMQRASLIDLSDLVDTQLLRGAGKRESPARSYTGLGQMESVVEWTPDYPYSAINWNLSAQTFPRKKLIIKRKRLINTDWCFLVDGSRTMDFGTEVDLKRVLAAQLAATFALAAQKKRDRVTLVTYDEQDNGLPLENASPDEMVVMALAHEPSPTANSPARSGLSFALAQLPDNQAIVPVISDFMHLTEADKENLLRASHYHNVFCCVVEDAREIGFPGVSGQITLSDMSSGRRQTMSFEEADRLVSADREKRLSALTEFFARARIPYALFEAGEKPSATRNKLVRLLQKLS
jgi:uncharacterized protein (DUF58 family)